MAKGTQLSEERRRRQNQRHPGRLRLQHQEAPQGTPFVAFQRAVRGNRSGTVDPTPDIGWQNQVC